MDVHIVWSILFLLDQMMNVFSFILKNRGIFYKAINFVKIS